jgi:hypothetical protein
VGGRERESEGGRVPICCIVPRRYYDQFNQIVGDLIEIKYQKEGVVCA